MRRRCQVDLDAFEADRSNVLRVISPHENRSRFHLDGELFANRLRSSIRPGVVAPAERLRDM